LSDKPKQAEAPSGTLDASALPAAALSGHNVIRYRAVTEGDIARLRFLEKPLSLVAAALFTGITLACSYPVYQIVSQIRAGAGSISLADLGVVAAWAGSLGIAVAAGVVSIRRRSKLMEALEAMSRRPSLPVAQPVRVGRSAPAQAPAKRRRFGFRRKTKIAV
jgi:hypothetical protein